MRPKCSKLGLSTSNGSCFKQKVWTCEINKSCLVVKVVFHFQKLDHKISLTLFASWSVHISWDILTIWPLHLNVCDFLSFYDYHNFSHHIKFLKKLSLSLYTYLFMWWTFDVITSKFYMRRLIFFSIKHTNVIFGRRLTTFVFVTISHKTLGKMLM